MGKKDKPRFAKPGRNGKRGSMSLIGMFAIVAGLIALQTTKGAAFWALVKGSRTEIRKVVWPTRQETVQTTMIVVVFVVLVALLLWGLDAFLGWLVSLAIT